LLYTQIELEVEAEDMVTTCLPPGNGAGPFWCYGSPLVVRLENDVFVSAMETGENIPPLCNTRWRLFRKHDDDKWEMVHASEKFNEREPCPVVCFDDLIFLSTNPSDQPVGTKYGNCVPKLLKFSRSNLRQKPNILYPEWDTDAFFTDHSYRGIASDGQNRELLLLNINARSSEQYWSFFDSTVSFVRNGRIEFPIRSCYPQVAMKNRSAHVLAIGDIVEPVEEWRKYKYEKTGSGWDYVFRRLFYTYAPDIANSGFISPVEIDELERTSGHISNLDLWIDNDGIAHVLYLKRTVQSNLMRDRFFPDTPITVSLEHKTLKDGKVIRHDTLIKGGEGLPGEVVGYARFHSTDDGRLMVIYCCGNENKLMQIVPDGNSKPVSLPLEKPFGMFFTATERGGSLPSDIIDMFGPGPENSLMYARIKIRRTK